MNDNENDPIATLVRLAGRRPALDAERTARVRRAVANEWRASVRRKRWTRLSAAAAVAATIAGVLLMRPRTEPAAAPVVAPLIATMGATKSIDWNGGTLRLDHGTQLRIDTPRTATLIRGAIYYANERPGAAVTIHTPFGDVRDVGTRFEVRLRDDALRVRVRDGAVIVRGTTARAGTELVASRTAVTSRTIATSGDEWAWIENAAPPIVLEGKSLDEVLRRIAIEKGLTLQRSGPDQILHGDVPLSVNEALDAATAAAGVTVRIEGDRLIVRGRS
ncbi:MAG TPA: FecR domain-containing protein [Thermoanaerobaculia bacterium]|nr:FecR domain-containing protein [Thermoanaerobaculia bacterium]